MEITVGQIVKCKRTEKMYRIHCKWKNVFGDEMVDLQNIKYPEVIFPELEKYLKIDFEIVAGDQTLY